MDNQSIARRVTKRRRINSSSSAVQNKSLRRKMVTVLDDTWIEALKHLTGPQWSKMSFVSRQIKGIVQRNISRLPRQVIESIALNSVALTNYLEDICYYIGICGENQYGYYRILDMGSVYFPDGDRSTYPDLIPFKSISFEENKEINERCKRLRDEIKDMNFDKYKDEILNPNMTEVNSETVCKLLRKYEAEARGWSFHLTHRNKSIVV